MKLLVCLSIGLVLLMARSAQGDIIVDNRAQIAMENRTEHSEIWCDVFYAGDFPGNEACATMLDGQWDVFPSCCNGAFNCLSGVVWDMVLCPSDHIYDFLAERCIPYNGVGCPKDVATPGDEMTTTEEPPISCNNVRTGKLPYSPDCTKFIRCAKGEPTLEDCPTGYIFYIPFSACLPGDLKHCALYQV